jgi:ribosomal protein S18 acetylase RimI-like enzyme
MIRPNQTFRLRAATPEDAEFLFQLQKATMREYVEQTWSWDEKWQRAHFQEKFDPTKNQIVVLDDRDIGVIAAERRGDEVFLTSIYILPEYQRRGIGTLLIKSVLDRAFQKGLPVRLRVLKVNPARRLYERLGFSVVEEANTHYLMKATPAQ